MRPPRFASRPRRNFCRSWQDRKVASSTRLDLAKWLCSAENPLTARVVMNRLWKHFFGTGISAQVDDLGAKANRRRIRSCWTGSRLSFVRVAGT